MSIYFFGGDKRADDPLEGRWLSLLTDICYTFAAPCFAVLETLDLICISGAYYKPKFLWCFLTSLCTSFKLAFLFFPILEAKYSRHILDFTTSIAMGRLSFSL